MKTSKWKILLVSADLLSNVLCSGLRIVSLDAGAAAGEVSGGGWQQRESSLHPRPELCRRHRRPAGQPRIHGAQPLQASLPSVPYCGQGIRYTTQGEAVDILIQLTSGCLLVERGWTFKNLCHLSLIVVKASDTQLKVRPYVSVSVLELKEATSSSISAICPLLWSRHQIHSSRWGQRYLDTIDIRLSSSWKRTNLQASLPSVPYCGQGIRYTAQGEVVGILIQQTSGCPQVERGQTFKHLCHLSLIVVKASDTQLKVRPYVSVSVLKWNRPHLQASLPLIPRLLALYITLEVIRLPWVEVTNFFKHLFVVIKVTETHLKPRLKVLVPSVTDPLHFGTDMDPRIHTYLWLTDSGPDPDPSNAQLSGSYVVKYKWRSLTTFCIWPFNSGLFTSGPLTCRTIRFRTIRFRTFRRCTAAQTVLYM